MDKKASDFTIFENMVLDRYIRLTYAHLVGFNINIREDEDEPKNPSNRNFFDVRLGQNTYVYKYIYLLSICNSL